MAKTNNNRDGKLIDTWTWKYQGVESDLAADIRGESDDPLDDPGKKADLVKEQVLSIEVRLLKQFKDEGLPRSEVGVQFMVRCEEIGVSLQGSDLERLRVAMWSKLEKAYEITWERWILVRIEPALAWSRGQSEGLELSQQDVYRGVAKDGSVLMRQYSRDRTYGPWTYSVWPGEYTDTNGKVVACIPATDFNEKSLDEFRKRIVELRNRLASLIRPENILKTLTNLNGIGLPAPDDSAS